MTAAVTRAAGRPRNPGLDRAILAAAERQLRELGYARMSLESVAAAAGTTVPSVRRRFRDKAGLAASVIPDDWAERTLRQAWPDAVGGAPGT
jgi:AcrR family transcriptional regulator